MDKSRYKRPPDVNEALSSMLWTPYDQATDSLSDDEREREKRKFNRHSNPLPSSLNWWNSHVPSIHPASSLRYSFPFPGNCVPSTNNNNNATNTSSTTTSSTMVHSFTDDFYQYQVIKIPHSDVYINKCFPCAYFIQIFKFLLLFIIKNFPLGSINDLFCLIP